MLAGFFCVTQIFTHRQWFFSNAGPLRHGDSPSYTKFALKIHGIENVDQVKVSVPGACNMRTEKSCSKLQSLVFALQRIICITMALKRGDVIPGHCSKYDVCSERTINVPYFCSFCTKRGYMAVKQIYKQVEENNARD